MGKIIKWGGGRGRGGEGEVERGIITRKREGVGEDDRKEGRDGWV